MRTPREVQVHATLFCMTHIGTGDYISLKEEQKTENMFSPL